MIGYNKYYNKKNGTKISLITDLKGIPFNVEFYKGNECDGKILMKQLKNTNLVELNKKIPNNAYFMGDPAYDTNEIRIKLKEMNYVPLIVQNRRNIKDKTKMVTLNNKEKEIYKKRLVIERTFNKMKMNRKICLRYESKIENFIGFVYLSLIKMLC